jgi:RNA polymerase-binding transcription factor DksA
VDLPDFGIFARCANPIPQGRIMLMRENVLCVSCAEKNLGDFRKLPCHKVSNYQGHL